MLIMGTGSTKMVVHPDRVNIYKGLETRVLELREEYGEITLVSGMCEGWDEAIAKVGIRNNIPFIAVIPHPTYGEYYWGKNSLTGHNRLHTFREIVAQAQRVLVTGNKLYGPDGLHINFHRNIQMVALSDYALVFNRFSKGTAHCYKEIKAMDMPYEEYPFQTRAA